MLHQRYKDALCGSSDGDRQRRGIFRGRLSIAAFAVVVFCSSAPADQPLTLVGPAGEATPRSGAAGSTTASLVTSPEQARASIQWLATLALERMPRTFDGDKDWGEQKKVWAGVHVKRDGWKLKTHRRFHDVNHGRWVQYEVTLPETTADNAAIAKVDSVHRRIDEASGAERWQIESSITAPMKFTARVQRWNVGVKVFSVTIRGDLRVRLISTASVGFVADYAEVPPALIVDPRIEKAELRLEHFEVDRVSRIGGDVAQEWGELIEDVIVDRFLKKQNDKLVTKLNKAIEKERDDLRLSMADWIANW